MARQLKIRGDPAFKAFQMRVGQYTYDCVNEKQGQMFN